MILIYGISFNCHSYPDTHSLLSYSPLDIAFHVVDARIRRKVAGNFLFSSQRMGCNVTTRTPYTIHYTEPTQIEMYRIIIIFNAHLPMESSQRVSSLANNERISLSKPPNPCLPLIVSTNAKNIMFMQFST